MFHFPGCPPMRLWIHLMVTGHCPGRVPPFGYSWINAYLQLPRTFRSLSRPSSAISAMASTLRSYSLDLRRKLPVSLPAFARSCRSFASSVHIVFLRLLRYNVYSDLFVSFLCSFQDAKPYTRASGFQMEANRLEWTRTTDLSLIRRVL